MANGQLSGAGERAAVEVALAEFNALRAEIVSTRTAQGAVIGAGLTAVGLAFTFALQQSGERELLLAVPPLALIASSLHVAESYRIHKLGDYIRCTLWPWLQVRTGYPHSWEAEHAHGSPAARNVVPAIMFDGAVPALFAAAALAALLLAEDVDWPVMVAGGLATLMTLAVPASFGIALKLRRDNERGGLPDAKGSA